ncbi:MAG TPA: DUF4136 domain-containing protein [Flavisolibacter sp.]|jgi:cellobiose-specific phosphotransferase system component IIB|nr:DUF4136 domain-containing protein [Flavisolibacter sp.]
MKKLALFTGILFSLSQATQAQDVGTDRELDANIEAYQTYDWSNKIDQIPTDAVFIGPNGVTVFNNETVRSKIKASVEYELGARGYKQTEQNPDFIVHFDVLEQPAEIITYNGYRLLHNGLDTVRTEENVDETSVAAGTVMVSFVDKKSGEMVWRGYASGILKPDMINDETKVRSAISSIFRDYNFKARGM